MVKLYLVETDACASCVSLRQEMSHLDVEVINEQQPVNEFVEKYDLQKLPAVLVTDDNQKLAVCYGYQPRFILDLWLESVLDKKENVNG